MVSGVDAPASIRIGERVARYVIVDKLGEGEMGVVYAAHDPELDRIVALKVLRRGAMETHADHGERLLREARALARIGHPNVVAVFDAGFHDERVFIAMERVDGVTLRAWCEMDPHPWEAVVRVFLDAGRGIAAAHDAGLVHGDFKPENALVGRDGRARVTDFGLAPTPAYMAPELLRGESSDARSDQFSFAVALYEGLYGTKPFDGTTPQELEQNILAGRIAEPEKGKNVPAWVRRALLRGLRANPNERYPSVSALLEALGRNPYVRWQRRGVWIGCALALAIGVWSAKGMMKNGGEPQCQDASQKLTGIWDESRKSAIREHFLATNLPYAEHTFRTVSTALDAYTQQWARGRTEACEATWVHRQQPAERLDARMHCLDERLNEVTALTGIYAQADRQAVQNAVVAAQSLSSPALCADAPPASTVPLPSDPARVARIEALKKKLAEISLQREAGHLKAALALAPAVAAEAREVDYAPLEAKALYLHGHLLIDVQPKEAEAKLYEAVWAAERARDDVTRARVWIDLLFAVGFQHRMNEVDVLDSQAKAAIARAGNNEDLELSRHQRLANVLHAGGRLAEARTEAETALEMARRIHGTESWQVGKNLIELGLVLHLLGEYPAAFEAFQSGRALVERVFGPMHPLSANALDGLGSVLSMQGKRAEATAAYRQELAIHESAVGSVHINVATCLDNLADELREQGNIAEAIPMLERSLDVREKLFGPDHPSLVFTLNGLGRTYLDAGKLPLARAQYERALKLCDETTNPAYRGDSQFGLAKVLGTGSRARALAMAARDSYHAAEEENTNELADVEAWLKAHPAR